MLWLDALPLQSDKYIAKPVRPRSIEAGRIYTGKPGPLEDIIQRR
jgi:hypothetical protein